MLANDILRGTHAHVGDDGFDFDRYENVNEHMNNVSHMPMSWYISKFQSGEMLIFFPFSVFCFSVFFYFCYFFFKLHDVLYIIET